MNKNILENMFPNFTSFFKRTTPTPAPLHPTNQQYELIISVWTTSQRGVTIFIMKHDKILWESKSNNPHSLQSDIQKANHMLKSIGLNPTHVRTIKKLNGKVIDNIEESLKLDEARRISRVSAVAPPKRLGLKVGDINELDNNQIEIILPRNDLETREKLLRPLLDKGYKFVNTVRNMKMDITTLKKPKNLEEETELNEYVLDVQQRRKRAITMRKYKTKLKLARNIKAKRLATTDQLKIRARRIAIQILRRKFAGRLGAEYKTLSPSQKMMIDKRVETKKKLVAKIAVRLLPRVRKKELERFRSRMQHKENTNAATTDIK